MINISGSADIYEGLCSHPLKIYKCQLILHVIPLPINTGLVCVNPKDNIVTL